MNLKAWQYLMDGLTKDGVDNHSMRDDLGNGNAVEWETAVFLYGLVRRINPEVCLETGRHFGLSSTMIAMALKDNWIDYPHRPQGHLYTCDPEPYGGRPEEIWTACEVSDYITNHVGNSYDWKTPARNIRFCFLDADHSAEAIIKEFTLFSPYFNTKRAYVMFHDTRLDVRMSPGIHHILDKIIPLLPYKHTSRIAIRNFRGLDLIMLSNEKL